MNISPQAWRRISEWLETALEMNPNDRDTWLKGLTATLPPAELPLLEPLKRLLSHQAHIETNDFLNIPPDFNRAFGAEANASSFASPLEADGEIGGYRLIRELGRGGMGSVWYAERIDGKLKRKVALKFPYAGPTQRQLAKRLLQERDILANLEHPNIARLYDADVEHADRPFLVLEYVDGIAIDEYCRNQRLSVKERLTLFQQVLQAVQYAHTRLVIHRDLKPSNMLVTADGVVRLLDFGIAKVLAPGPNANLLTEVGGRVLTPNFASPEQIAGCELTTASDVYSLGVVIYELLTGARPYRLKREGRGSLEEAIETADIIAPSEAARGRQDEFDAANAARELKGDLDTILLKSLKKPPEERYSTVAAFADDIARYLRSEPVLAQRDSPWYRLRKFANRNRLAVGASLAIVASLSVGLSLALWQLHSARVAQKRAEDVKEFIASIFRSADPFFTGSKSMSAVEVLALARQRIDREMHDQPDIAIELLDIIGESQANLEQYPAARATFEQAIALNRKAPPNELQLAQLRAQLGIALINDGDFTGATTLFAESVPVLRKGDAKTARTLSDTLQFQAYLEVRQGHTDLAIAKSREAYAAVLAALGPSHAETILSKRQLAQQLITGGQREEGLLLAKQAFEEAQAVFAPGERNALLAETETLYGRALVEMNELEQGIAHLNHSKELTIQIYGLKSEPLANLLSYLMRAQLRLGDYAGVIDTSIKAVEASLDERSAAHPLTNLGDNYLRARKLEQAEPKLRQAVEAETKYESLDGPWLSVAQGSYATTLLYLGHSAEARALLQQAYSQVGESKADITMPYWNAVGIERRVSGDWAESEQAFRKLLARTTNSTASARWRTEAWNGIGIAQLEMGRIEEADTSLHEADKAVQIAYRRMTPQRADVLVSLTRLLLKQGHATEALPLIEEADRFWQSYDAGIRWAGEAAYWHAQALAAVNKSEAQAAYRRAAVILKKSPMNSDVKLANAAATARF